MISLDISYDDVYTGPKFLRAIYFYRSYLIWLYNMHNMQFLSQIHELHLGVLTFNRTTTKNGVA